MNTVPIEIQRIRQAAILPHYAQPGDAGLDLYSAAALRLAPGERARVPTGLKPAIPDGYEGQVRPKSGLADKHGLTVLNAPGTIDAGFRGELEVLLINHGQEAVDITVKMKIAQLVIAPVSWAEIVEVTALTETTRGDGGFGSTGLTATGVSE